MRRYMTMESGLLLLESILLSAVLKNYFDECEDKMNPREYLLEVCKQTGATLEHLAREFHLDKTDLQQLVQ